MQYTIREDCIGCTLCAKKCPIKAIAGEKKVKHVIDQSACNACGDCFRACNRGAIYDSTGKNNGKVVKKTKKLVAFIDINICIGCKNCIPNCNESFAIFYSKGRLGGYSTIDTADCLGCRGCQPACPHSAISMKEIDR